jgi:transposase
MKTEDFYDLLLHLNDNWEVREIAPNMRAKEIDIYVDYVGKLAKDPDSQDMLPVYDHRENRRWRHLNTMEYKTWINCCVPRIKDSSGKVKTIEVPWAEDSARFTFLFERFAIDLLQATKNQRQTAALLDCGYNIVNRIMHRASERGMERRRKDYPIYHLSLDEKSFHRGHKYVTVLSDPLGDRVLDVADGRDKKACEGLIANTLSKEQKACIRTVSMDMWKAYMNVAAKQMPQAEIVHDKFHLVKYLTEAIDKVRRREVKVHDELKNARYALLKNKMNLTDKQSIKFESIKEGNYEVCKAWGIRENFQYIFGERTKQEAFALFGQWCSDALRSKIKEVTKVVEIFRNHVVGVVNAMVRNLSNAMAERLNGKIQILKTVGRGYRKFSNFRSAILFFHGDLDLYPQ